VDRLERIELRRLEAPLRAPYKLAFGPVRHFDTMHVEVRDAAGAVGYGEATVLTGYTDETVEGAWANLRQWADEIAGLAPDEAKARLLARVDDAPFAVTALVTAIEMMQRDPLLAVETPTDVPMLGLLNAEAPEAIAREVDELIAKGFRTLKVKVGFDADADAARVRVIQRIVAGRVSLRLDGNQGYSTDDAVCFASGLDPAGIELFEQPCAAGDWDAASAVARVATVPMMVDESIYGLADIRRTAELGCARFVKVKLMKFGSLARLAEAMAAHGAVPGIQLNHAGRKASVQRPWHGFDPLTGADLASRGEAPWQTVSASALPANPGWPTPLAIDRDGIRRSLDDFAAATRRARQAGYRAMNIHGAHGYLIHSFLSPLSNQRDDAYGGSLANRMRYALEVAEAVRSE